MTIGLELLKQANLTNMTTRGLCISPKPHTIPYLPGKFDAITTPLDKQKAKKFLLEISQGLYSSKAVLGPGSHPWNSAKQFFSNQILKLL